jgi:hypothetical protein
MQAGNIRPVTIDTELFSPATTKLLKVSLPEREVFPERFKQFADE